MNLQNTHKDHMKIGRYQSWMEDGQLKLYCHEFGNSSGMYCSMSVEETKGLLELLSRNSTGINEALYVHENDAIAQSHFA
ncbi:hypothetical protein [Dictyobacter arantiisoli]|uniref:Uncharacterized protein n=1 Tax=Dictyobacter arantiisoli TaxID=2014874 RepID=A0A5A5TD61_9CHLR|nr:hypothetical protein [Dictyobacter arantiisoli]GCF09106.1 hypothetical protein KDI_26700 [Dictyobacter arantiisoli]